jgi:predicted nucleic acid-binding protein
MTGTSPISKTRAFAARAGVPAECFVDASAWYPIALAKHPDHARLARALTDRVRRGTRIVTTNLVLAESHALLTTRVDPRTALRFLEAARSRPNVVVESTAELEDAAQRDWLRKYDDHRFSLADAVSFAVMKARGIHEALTLDHHFSIAGFAIVGDRSR